MEKCKNGEIAIIFCRSEGKRFSTARHVSGQIWLFHFFVCKKHSQFCRRKKGREEEWEGGKKEEAKLFNSYAEFALLVVWLVCFVCMCMCGVCMCGVFLCLCLVCICFVCACLVCVCLICVYHKIYHNTHIPRSSFWKIAFVNGMPAKEKLEN